MTERQLRPALLAVRRAIPVAAVLCVLAGCSALGTGNKPAAPAPLDEPVERGQERAAGTSPSTPPAPSLPQRPTKHHLRVSQFVFYSNFPLEAADPLFRELEDLPDQLRRELRLPLTTSLVQVYLFEDQDGYEAFLRAWHPKLPLRPAYFIADKRGPGGTTELLVYTYVGRRLRTDLRHELTHALLHGVLKGVPLWLDEGLAGFFEQPTANDGLNTSHLESLRVGPFQPNLARLEKLTEVADMQRAEYQEAWAWVHFLLRGRAESRQVLLTYLQSLRTSGSPGQLMPKLEAVHRDPNRALLEHLAGAELPSANRTEAEAGR